MLLYIFRCLVLSSFYFEQDKHLVSCSAIQSWLRDETNKRSSKPDESYLILGGCFSTILQDLLLAKKNKLSFRRKKNAHIVDCVHVFQSFDHVDNLEVLEMGFNYCMHLKGWRASSPTNSHLLTEMKTACIFRWTLLVHLGQFLISLALKAFSSVSPSLWVCCWHQGASACYHTPLLPWHTDHSAHWHKQFSPRKQENS